MINVMCLNSFLQIEIYRFTELNERAACSKNQHKICELKITNLLLNRRISYSLNSIRWKFKTVLNFRRLKENKKGYFWYVQ